jgi:pyridoxal phosphate enzyme (YggS family)
MFSAQPDSAGFAVRLASVRARIDAAARLAGRDPSGVRLLAVTKGWPAAAVAMAASHGLNAFGENRVQEGVAKRAQCAGLGATWELIGHLQSNKVRLAAEHFDRVQSVDGAKLVAQLARAAGEFGRTLPILLQINAGHDPAKFGVDAAEAAGLLGAALALPNLRVEGLMTIAPLAPIPAETAALAERTFVNLRTIRDDLAARFRLPLSELSMGMSGDLEAAIAAGSTLVRVGTALFGDRAAIA